MNADKVKSGNPGKPHTVFDLVCVYLRSSAVLTALLFIGVHRRSSAFIGGSIALCRSALT
jgi:hypothetical protein